MITEGDSITHNSVVSDSGRVVSVAHEKVDGVAVVEVTSNRRRKPLWDQQMGQPHHNS